VEDLDDTLRCTASIMFIFNFHLVESIIASFYAISANRDRICALGLAFQLSCTFIEHGRTVTTVSPKSHRKFLRTVFSNRKFLSMVLHSMICPLLALLTVFKSSKTKKNLFIDLPLKLALNRRGFLRKGVLPIKENAVRQIATKSF
jgi:hypothetical protein